jgi:hypothetical protein
MQSLTIISRTKLDIGHYTKLERHDLSLIFSDYISQFWFLAYGSIRLNSSINARTSSRSDDCSYMLLIRVRISGVNTRLPNEKRDHSTAALAGKPVRVKVDEHICMTNYRELIRLPSSAGLNVASVYQPIISTCKFLSISQSTLIGQHTVVS